MGYLDWDFLRSELEPRDILEPDAELSARVPKKYWGWVKDPFLGDSDDPDQVLPG